MLRPNLQRAITDWACVLLLANGCASDLPRSTPACAVSSFTIKQGIAFVDRVDLLFVVDDSPLMAPVQPLVQREIARIVRLALTGGEGDVPNPFPRLLDLHVGFITADMGAGASHAATGCSEHGDDAVLAIGPSCATDDPRYVWSFAGYHDPAAVTAAVSCRSEFGVSSCAIAQPLEAALKALSPGNGPGTHFGDGTFGHGNTENARFVRNDPARGLSLVIVAVITNQDDCSAEDLPPSTATEPLGLRCALGQNRLYAVQRYVDGLRALRPGYEELVKLVLLAGIPTDLTHTPNGAPIDFDAWDPERREAQYAQVLADPRMQLRVGETPDNVGTSFVPSCTNGSVTAYPPRRLVETARAMRSNATLGSLCDAKPSDALVELLAAAGGEGGRGPHCIRHRMVRNRAGKISCRMTWELPRDPDPDQLLTPAACDQRPGVLSTPEAGFPRIGPDGGVLCEVRQAPLLHAPDGSAFVDGEGFYYYDDFSSVERTLCFAQGTGVGFTPAAKLPTGVVVRLECIDDIQREVTRSDPTTGVREPIIGIGTACDRIEIISGSSQPLQGDALCAATSRPGLFCHPERNVCVRACELDAQCPTDWICDSGDSELARSAGRAICVNPGCSVEN
jgi:hypothetical protein